MINQDFDSEKKRFRNVNFNAETFERYASANYLEDTEFIDSRIHNLDPLPSFFWCNFSNSSLYDCYVRKGDLKSVTFKTCNITRVYWNKSDLIDVDFIDCTLVDVNLNAACIQNIRFKNSTIKFTENFGLPIFSPLMINVQIWHDEKEQYIEVKNYDELLRLLNPKQ